MTTPILHAFFVGRALAEAINDGAERLVTEALSNLGKFDAEQREHLRQFTDQVITRAQQAETEVEQGTQPPSSGFASADLGQSQDLQATIDTLRAEIAQVRVALQQYRTPSDGN